MSNIHINLVGTPADLDAASMIPTIGPREEVLMFGETIHMDLITGGTAEGRSVIKLWADDQKNVAVMFMTARNFLSMAAAIRGRLAETGEMNVGQDPPLAMIGDPAKGLVHFAFETPFQSFDYSIDQAEKLHHVLGQMIADAKRK